MSNGCLRCCGNVDLRAVSVKRLAMTLVVVGVLSGCVEPGSRDVILARNDSAERQEVDVSYFVEGEEEQFLVRVPVGGSPGLREAITGRCTEGFLIARYLDGEEVERRGPGVCVGTVWRINGDSAD